MPGGGIKKVVDDLPIDPGPRFPRPPIFRGLSPFLLSTGHHADVGAAAQGGLGADAEVMLAEAFGAAAAAVDEARRNVVALQTALTSATSELARAQEGYDAVVAAMQSLG